MLHIATVKQDPQVQQNAAKTKAGLAVKAALWKSNRYGSAQDATFAALFASSFHNANVKQKETTAEGKEVKGQG